MAVPIKPGQWGRSEVYGWTLSPFVSLENDECLYVIVALPDHEPTVESYFKTGHYLLDQNPSNSDVIEVSDTDPRASEVDSPRMIEVSKIEELLGRWQRTVKQSRECGNEVNDIVMTSNGFFVVASSIENCMRELARLLLPSLSAEKNDV